MLLTERGAALSHTAADNAAQVDEIALAGLSPEERAQLSDLMARVIRNLKAMGGAA